MSKKAKSFTRGGQIAFHNLRMWNQINKTVMQIAVLIWVLLTAALAYLITPYDVLMAAYYWCYAKWGLKKNRLKFYITDIGIGNIRPHFSNKSHWCIK